MSYTKIYSGNSRQILAAGLDDAKAYLSEERAECIIAALIEACRIDGVRYTVAHYHFPLKFAGIQGVPAAALMNEAIKRYRNAR